MAAPIDTCSSHTQTPPKTEINDDLDFLLDVMSILPKSEEKENLRSDILRMKGQEVAPLSTQRDPLKEREETEALEKLNKLSAQVESLTKGIDQFNRIGETLQNNLRQTKEELEALKRGR